MITVLRALAEGRIRWAFWPPGTDSQTITKHQGAGSRDGSGIWIAHGLDGDGQDEEDCDSDEQADVEGHPGGSEDEQEAASSDAGKGEEVSEDDREDGVPVPAGSFGRQIAGTGSRFGALVLDDEDDSEH